MIGVGQTRFDFLPIFFKAMLRARPAAKLSASGLGLIKTRVSLVGVNRLVITCRVSCQVGFWAGPTPPVATLGAGPTPLVATLGAGGGVCWSAIFG